jgi:hypothetical protein
MKQKYIKYNLSEAIHRLIFLLGKKEENWKVNAIKCAEDIFLHTGSDWDVLVDSIKPGCSERTVFYAVLGDMQKRKIDTRGIV